MKAFAFLALAALSSVAMAQDRTPIGETGPVRDAVVDLPDLRIDAVTPTFAYDPRIITITGVGLHRVEHVYIGSTEGVILSRTSDELQFLHGPGHPGFWPVVVTTPFETAESSVMYMPALHVRKQAVIWNDDHTAYHVVDNAFGVHMTNGGPGFYVLYTSLDPRDVPLVLTNPPTDFHFLLGSPYRILAAGFFDSADEVVYQFRLPASLMGEPICFQALCMRDVGPGPQYRCFTNMEEKFLY